MRKLRGFRSARDLAEAVPGGSITESIIQNIEAGRKADLTLSQFLNLAMALRVAPTYLLVAMGRPHDTLDLPNLSPDFDGMTALQFDAWLSGSVNAAYQFVLADEQTERLHLKALRELDQLKKERLRVQSMAKLALELPQDDSGSAHPWDSADEYLLEADRRITQIEYYLSSAGWDFA